MTYETGTATTLEDLLAKLSTFATTTHGGWTEGYLNTTNGWFELHKGNLSVSFRWTKTGTPTALSVHQATAFVGTGTAPGAHTNDSGNGWNTSATGHTNANIISERHVSEIGNGPFVSYHFFADDSGPDYIHVVVEPVAGMFRHFGFGTLDKFGNNWVGGEYAYGHVQEQSPSATPVDTDTTCLLDGLATSPIICSTVRIASGLANQGAAVWGVVTPSTATLLTDTAGNIRQKIHGSFRSGLTARNFGNVVGNFSSGAISLYGMPVWYKDPSNPRVYLLGYHADVRGVNVRNFEPAQEVTIGSDVWLMFPLSIRSNAAVTARTRHCGIAYRKVA